MVVDGNKVEEFDFESENKRQLAGNIYLAKVTRVEPSLQAAFVDYGGNRHGFLAFSEIHPDYYQIPVADREALMEEERAYAEAQRARTKRTTSPSAARALAFAQPRLTQRKISDDGHSIDVSGMETIDLDEEAMRRRRLVADGAVRETPVEEPMASRARPRCNGDDDADDADARRRRPLRRCRRQGRQHRICRRRRRHEDIRPVAQAAPRNATRSRKSSRSARSCWFRSSRKSAATRARR